MDYDFVKLELEDEVGTLVLNRPPANLLNIAMMEEINAALMSLHRSEGLKVLLMRGADHFFSDGWDMKEHLQKRVQRLLQVFMRIFETMRMMDLITVAGVEGRAWGAGFELALGCNLIVASETATFALPQINHGILPPVASAVLPRIAPRRRAMEWVLTGNAISAHRLEHDGVISRLFPVDHFEEKLTGFLVEITSKSGPVLHLAKKAQMEAYYTTFPKALGLIQNLYLKELMPLHDAKEGPKAAREGREAVWKNA